MSKGLSARDVLWNWKYQNCLGKIENELDNIDDEYLVPKFPALRELWDKVGEDGLEVEYAKDKLEMTNFLPLRLYYSIPVRYYYNVGEWVRKRSGSTKLSVSSAQLEAIDLLMSFSGIDMKKKNLTFNFKGDVLSFQVSKLVSLIDDFVDEYAKESNITDIPKEAKRIFSKWYEKEFTSRKVWLRRCQTVEEFLLIASFDGCKSCHSLLSQTGGMNGLGQVAYLFFAPMMSNFYLTDGKRVEVKNGYESIKYEMSNVLARANVMDMVSITGDNLLVCPRIYSVPDLVKPFKEVLKLLEVNYLQNSYHHPVMRTAELLINGSIPIQYHDASMITAVTSSPISKSKSICLYSDSTGEALADQYDHGRMEVNYDMFYKSHTNMTKFARMLDDSWSTVRCEICGDTKIRQVGVSFLCLKCMEEKFSVCQCCGITFAKVDGLTNKFCYSCALKVRVCSICKREDVVSAENVVIDNEGNTGDICRECYHLISCCEQCGKVTLTLLTGLVQRSYSGRQYVYCLEHLEKCGVCGSYKRKGMRCYAGHKKKEEDSVEESYNDEALRKFGKIDPGWDDMCICGHLWDHHVGIGCVCCGEKGRHK